MWCWNPKVLALEAEGIDWKEDQVGGTGTGVTRMFCLTL
jgi:hypothetical protein